MKKHREEKIGELAAVGNLILDGFWPVGVAYGTQVLHLPPVELLGIASLGSALLFLVLTLYRGTFKQLFSWSVFKGCVLYTSCLHIAYAAIFYATENGTAITTALLTQTELIFAGLIGWLFLREKLQASRILGLSLVLLASLLVLYNGSLELDPNSLILVFAPILFVFGNAVAKRLQAEGLDFAPLLLFRGVVGGVTMLVFSAVFEGFVMPDSSNWVFLLGFGLLAFGVPKALWQIALGRIDLSKLTGIGMSHTAFSFIFAYFWMGEIPTVYQYLGLILTVLGLFFLVKSTSRRSSDLLLSPD